MWQHEWVSCRDEGGNVVFFAHLSRYAAPKIPLLKWERDI